MKDSSFNNFYETYIYSLKEQLESIIHAKNDVEIKQYMQSVLGTRLGNYYSLINSNFSLLSNLFEQLNEEEIKNLKKDFINVYNSIYPKLTLINDFSDKDKILINVNECLNILDEFEKSIKELERRHNIQKDLISILEEFNNEEPPLDVVESFYNILTDVLLLLKNMNIDETEKEYILKISSELVSKGQELDRYKWFIGKYENKMSEEKYNNQKQIIKDYINRLINIEKEYNNIKNDDAYSYMLVSLVADTNKMIKNVKEILSGKIMTDEEKENIVFDLNDKSAIIPKMNKYDLFKNVEESAFIKDKKSNSLEDAGLLEDFKLQNESSKTDVYINDIMNFVNKKPINKGIEEKPTISGIRKTYSKTIKSVSSRKYDDLKKRHDEIEYKIQNKLQRNEKITLSEAFEECKLRRQLELVKLSVNDILKIIKFTFVSNKVMKIRKNNLCKDNKTKKGIFSKKLNIQKTI